MQNTLAKIEARGTFYSAESHSPNVVEEYDTLNDLVGKRLAATVQGALAKAWVAWSANTVGGSEKKRRFGDLVRRRDLNALATMENELDWEHHTMLTLIQSLTHISEAREHGGRGVLTPTLASELERYSKKASALETLLLKTDNVLQAIDGGHLLESGPTDPCDYDKYCAAVGLLHILQDEIKRYEKERDADADTDLSICLRVRSTELKRAG
jgi:hypothetical protein